MGECQTNEVKFINRNRKYKKLLKDINDKSKNTNFSHVIESLNNISNNDLQEYESRLKQATAALIAIQDKDTSTLIERIGQLERELASKQQLERELATKQQDQSKVD